MVEAVGGNQPNYNVIQVKGCTVARDEGTISIAQSVKADILKGTSQGLQDATSKLMDLWLESADNKINAVLTILKDELPSETFRQFNDSYLQPSVNVMSKISGGSKVAEQFDYSVSVKSTENLKNAGIRFFSGRGTLEVNFASNVRIMDASDGHISTGDRWAYIFDGSEKGVEIKEQPDGTFALKITYPESQMVDLYIITVPNQEPAPANGGYTPGTRYAVVTKDEIDYTK